MTCLLTWPCAPHSFPLRCSLPGSVKDWVLRRHFGPLCPHCGCGRTRSSGWKVLPGVPCCCKPEEVSKPGSPYETDCKRSLETSFPIHWWPRLPRNTPPPPCWIDETRKQTAWFLTRTPRRWSLRPRPTPNDGIALSVLKKQEENNLTVNITTQD